ncbi:MAG: type II toxin-antitoxin system RelE/ParE family toxin [Planctomycetaceae bacterium]|nr:type II toxin-antitoxin system RelE/ParE family toxin [Planctomycetaceae bacterium]
MEPYEIAFARSARKELERLGESLQTRILERIERLEGQPRPNGCRKLEGAEDLWRIRIGEYRVIYLLNDVRRSVDVIAIRHRSDAYR